jgi:hypothetical protein
MTPFQKTLHLPSASEDNEMEHFSENGAKNNINSNIYDVIETHGL